MNELSGGWRMKLLLASAGCPRPEGLGFDDGKGLGEGYSKACYVCVPEVFRVSGLGCKGLEGFGFEILGLAPGFSGFMSYP